MVCEIKLLSSAQIPQAAFLLGHAMLDNPLHVKVFGTDKHSRRAHLESFFNLLLPVVAEHGFIYGAYRNGQLAGVMGAIKPAYCDMPAQFKLKLTLKIFKLFGLVPGIRVIYWLFNWHSHDLKSPHWHLGPLAVCAAQRRQGIAAQLMDQVLALANKSSYPLWLETDKQENVDYYLRRGFEIKKTIKIYQITNWLMIKNLNSRK